MGSSSQVLPVSTQDEGPMLIAVSVFFIVVTTIVVPLRFFARYLANVGFWWDDWILLVAWVSKYKTCIQVVLSHLMLSRSWRPCPTALDGGVRSLQHQRKTVY